MGTTLAGILGAILAAPVAATLKLLGTYAWRKLFDQPPFAADEAEPEEEEQSIREWVKGWFGRTESVEAKSEQNQKTTKS